MPTPGSSWSGVAGLSGPGSWRRSCATQAGPAGEQPRFEQALARLEQIVRALEAGNLSLDESLRVFEEGTGLLRLCTRRLDEVERRIEILMRHEGGSTVRPFTWEEGQA